MCRNRLFHRAKERRLARLFFHQQDAETENAQEFPLDWEMEFLFQTETRLVWEWEMLSFSSICSSASFLETESVLSFFLAKPQGMEWASLSPSASDVCESASALVLVLVLDQKLF